MKKIADVRPVLLCRNPQHDPPTLILLEPGIYEHECPGCGLKQTIIINPKPTL